MSENSIATKSVEKWKIMLQTGRHMRKVGEGDEAKMRDEFDRLAKAGGMPGTLQLLDPTGGIDTQLGSMSQDDSRRGTDPATGKSYEPTVAERGHAVDLSRFADFIRSMPETDPALDPPAAQEHLEEDQEDEEVEKLRQTAPAPAPVHAPVSPPPKPQSELAKLPILAFAAGMVRVLGGLQQERAKLQQKRRRFFVELVKQVALGSPLDGKLVVKSLIAAQAQKK